MKFSFILIIFLYKCNLLFCQTPISYQENVINSAIGNVQIGQIFENQISEIDSIYNKVCVSVNPYKFGLSELNQIQLSGLFAINKSIDVGLRFKGNNSDIYKEFAFSTNLRYKLEENISLSIIINYNNIFIKDFNKFSQFNVDISSKLKIDNRINVGIKLENLNRSKYDQNKNIYQRFIGGIDYNITDLSFVELASRINFNLNSGLILSYKTSLTNNFKIKIAIDSGYKDIESTVLYNFKEFDFIMGSTYNNVLGFNPHIELVYKW